MGKADGFIDLIRTTCDSSYMCNIVYDEEPISFPTLTIDADGEFRLCLRISGTTKMYAQDVFTNDKECYYRFVGVVLYNDNSLKLSHYIACCLN